MMNKIGKMCWEAQLKVGKPRDEREKKLIVIKYGKKSYYGYVFVAGKKAKKLYQAVTKDKLSDKVDDAIAEGKERNYQDKKSIIKTKDITLDIFIEKFKKSCKRIIHYIKSKIGDMLKNIAGNAISKFLKSFFDIVISVLKATVKRIASAAKQVVMSLISCVRTIADKNMSAAQKADAVTKTLAVVISGIVLEILFEYMEKQFGLPDFLMEPLQIVVTILSTNAIMLILQKLDLFNVQYGFLIANMEKIFNETNEKFIAASNELIETGEKEMEQQMKELNDQIHDITETIQQLDFYKESAQPQLQQMSDTFAMGIDFDTEWKEFIMA